MGWSWNKRILQFMPKILIRAAAFLSSTFIGDSSRFRTVLWETAWVQVCGGCVSEPSLSTHFRGFLGSGACSSVGRERRCPLRLSWTILGLFSKGLLASKYALALLLPLVSLLSADGSSKTAQQDQHLPQIPAAAVPSG